MATRNDELAVISGALAQVGGLEHKIKYKKDSNALPINADNELAACAALCAEVDDRMQALRDAIE